MTTFVWGWLLASILSLASLAMSWPALRMPGWSRWRKLRHVATALIFTAFAALVFVRGGFDIFSI
jgi:hypothetical protein